MTTPSDRGGPGAPDDSPGTAVPTCYRHPGRETYVRCARCDRPICPDCMNSASVGFQCPECVREGNRNVRAVRTTFGGRVTGNVGVVSKVLIAVNVVIFLAQQVMPDLTQNMGMIGLALDPEGQRVGVADGESYRLMTAAFLHGGILHLLFNMYALFVFGPTLENALGRLRFGLVYLLSALGGSAASYAFNAPNQLSVGASGAIFGLLGATLVVSKRLRYDVSALGVLIAINLALGFVIPRIDWRAHVGGLVVGLVVGAAFAYAPKRLRTPVQLGAAAVVALAILAGVIARTGALTGNLTG